MAFTSADSMREQWTASRQPSMTASVPRWSSAGLSAVWPTLAINHLTAHIDTLTTPIDLCRLNRQRDTLLDGLSLHGQAIRDDLRAGLPALPIWMQEFLRGLLNSAGTDQAS